MRVGPVLLRTSLVVVLTLELIASGTLAAESSLFDPSDQMYVEDERFIEQGVEELEAPFTRERVLILNGIVASSLQAIEDFDREKLDIEKAIDAAIRQDATASVRSDGSLAMKRMTELSDRAHRAQRQMKLAASVLQASRETYNEAILVAMVTFVSTVNVEVRDARIRISNKHSPG